MTIRMKNIFLVCIALLIFNESNAQQLSSPIQPIANIDHRQDLGIFVGLGQNFQSGDMYVDCEECTFSGGAGFGINFGILYEYIVLERISLGASVVYKSLGFNAGFQEIETLDSLLIQEGSTIYERANVKFSHEANIDIHNFTFAPYIKWTPLDFMFLRAGLGIGTNFSTNIKHRKRLDQKTARLSSGEIVTLKDVSEDDYIQDTEIPSLISPQIYLSPVIGFNIPFSDKITFSPSFEYSIPFSEFSEFGSGLKSNYWRILFELRLRIDDPND